MAVVAVIATLLAGAPSLKAAEQMKIDVAMAKPYLMAGQKQSSFLRVGLTGLPIDAARRTPVNLAIVLDKSGSMQGDKLRKAKDAALASIDRLGPNDIVSVVAYDHTVEVLVPATKISDRAALRTAIERLSAGGNTALFAGVSKGAAEVRKFVDRQRVNRIILLSDGQANLGPSSPTDLGNLGASLLKEGISVTTLGLGLDYNEDLMVQLARKSGGNHHFIQKATELADIFRGEFEDVLSVVAQEVDVKVRIAEGIRPVRVLGNDADINGQQIVTRMAQIYSDQNKYIVVEVEIPSSESNSHRELANVSVSYTNMKTLVTDRLSSSSSIRFSSSKDEVERSLNKSVLADVAALVSSENNKLATKYLDEGNLLRCREILKDNVDFLNVNSAIVPNDERLKVLSQWNGGQLSQLEGVADNTDDRARGARKLQIEYQNAADSQQRSAGSPAKP
jgi:Ca-activated chloride channel family protein